MSVAAPAHLVLTSEARLWRTPDGCHWGATAFGYAEWARYLAVFDRTTLLARVAPRTEPPVGTVRVDGAGVCVSGLTPYSGPIGFATAVPRLTMELRRRVSAASSLLVQVPSPIGGLALRSARAGRPYGVEVKGDPYDVLAPGVVQHPLRPLLQRTAARQLRRQCSAAAVAIYVTRDALQRRYPVGAAGQAFVASNVMLDDDAFVADRQTGTRVGRPLRIATVGSLAQRYKGVDVLIDAVSGLAALGLHVHLDVVGAGRYLPELQAQAGLLCVGEYVTFHGELDRQGVRAVLDGADLFVLASRTEGLPRALLEAMARSLPCVGTNVGGVPELLQEQYLARTGDPLALRDRILDVLRDPDALAALGRRNQEVARGYRSQVLQDAREKAYSRLLEVTARRDAMSRR